MAPVMLCTALMVRQLRSYRTTLNARDVIDDEKEKEEILKACHKRCAERTLKVLEKNGGIFIKLGQHLVCPSPTHHSSKST